MPVTVTQPETRVSATTRPYVWMVLVALVVRLAVVPFVYRDWMDPVRPRALGVRSHRSFHCLRTRLRKPIRRYGRIGAAASGVLLSIWPASSKCSESKPKAQFSQPFP